MGAPAGHDASSSRRRPPAWGEPRPGIAARLVAGLRGLIGGEPTARTRGLPELPVAMRRGPFAEAYRTAERSRDHAGAGRTAADAAERAIAAEEWWPADVWAHRALWHFEQGDLTLEAARQARRIGDLRVAAGDPASARRYYAEAIDEARDIGAEHEQGLAALGMGRAQLDLGEVTVARRLASAAVTLLERSGASAAEIGEARALLGTEVAVGEGTEEVR
jgi:tetratricopeptide (TPR) repeat protein